MSDESTKAYLQARIELNRSFADPRRINRLLRGWRDKYGSDPVTILQLVDIWGDSFVTGLAYVLAKAEGLSLIKMVWIAEGNEYATFLDIPDDLEVDYDDILCSYFNLEGVYCE